jgi:integrase
MVYFGSWADPDAALAKYLDQKDALHAGLTPRADTRQLTVKDLANDFLNAKQALIDTGELSPRTWTEYKAAADLIVTTFGKHRLVTDVGTDDFARLRKRMAQSWGPHRLAKMIQYIRSVFKHGYDATLMDRPIRFGPGFNRPSKKTMRLHKAAQGPKLFTADEIRRVIQAARQPLKAMILLGINCGFGNADCGHLPMTALDLDGGWVNFPRPKTGINRRCPLWPETVEAITAALSARPVPKSAENADLVFVTKYGYAWAKDEDPGVISKEMTKLLRRLGTSGRKGAGFYTLRHTFRTVADAAKDQPAADFIMGHEVPHMSAVYRETISDERLRAVTDHVRTWLFTESAAKPTAQPAA